MCLQIIILLLALNVKSFKYIISLFLILKKIYLHYQISETMSVFYFSIKFLHNKIFIPIGLIYPKIPIFIKFFYSKIFIFMELFLFRIPILIKLFWILNWFILKYLKRNRTNGSEAGFYFYYIKYNYIALSWPIKSFL